MNHLNSNTPFWRSVDKSFNGGPDTPKFLINGVKTNYLGYQIAAHKRQIALYVENLKPSMTWSIEPLKEYYGLTGPKNQLLGQIIDIQQAYQTIYEKFNLSE